MRKNRTEYSTGFGVYNFWVANGGVGRTSRRTEGRSMKGSTLAKNG